MTKIMAVTIVPVLMLFGIISAQNEGPSQDAKSVAIDATHAKLNIPSAKDEQRRREEVLERASRDQERDLNEWRRARAKARAEAKAERKAERQAERQAVRQAEREAEAEAATQAATRETNTSSGSGNLPQLLLFIRSNESGGNYSAYNGSGCEGYGCYGAYQMHGAYMDDWARRYGAGGYAGTPANQWPPAIQDQVALGLFYSTNPDGAHWCNWTDYC